MKTVSLSAIKSGITRLRIKGGANPETLYDAVNCYVTAARTVKPRPGSQRTAGLPPETVGLSLFNGVFQVFSDRGGLAVPSGYKLNVLSHPDSQGGTVRLARIWKAEPFMGALYVVAEWSDGAVYHYYLQVPVDGAWSPGATHTLGGLTVPTVPNGFTYRATRLGEVGTLWAPDQERAQGDVIEPTTFNGFEYVAIEAYGLPPRSGATEPAWPTEDGAVVVEEADSIAPPPVPQLPPPPVTPPRYDNPGGGTPGGPGTGGPRQPPRVPIVQF